MAVISARLVLLLSIVFFAAVCAPPLNRPVGQVPAAAVPRAPTATPAPTSAVTSPPPGGLALVLDRMAYDPAQRALAWGAGFQPGARVELVAVGDIYGTTLRVSARADRQGSFRLEWPLPNTAWGEIFDVTASDAAGRTSSARFVLAPGYRYAWRPCDHGV